MVPTKPPARTEGRRARTAPPTTTRCVSATKMLACGRYTSWRRRSAASSGLASRSTRRSASLKATRRSISVTRAARTRYSTPKVRTSQGGDRRPSTGAIRPWVGTWRPATLPTWRAMRLATRAMAHGGGAADRYCIRVADGYDTASFRRSPARRPSTVLHRRPSRTAARPADALGGHRRRAASTRATGEPRIVRVGSRRETPTEGRSGTAGRSDIRRRMHEAHQGRSARRECACSSSPRAHRPPAGRPPQRQRRQPAAQPEVCKNKKGTSSNEIHVYSSLPRQGSNTAQTERARRVDQGDLDGKTVGDFTIKYTDLDDSSAANNGDWDGAVAQQNATTAASDPDAMVFIGHFNSGAAKLTDPDPQRRLPRHDQPREHVSGPDHGGRGRHRAG